VAYSACIIRLCGSVQIRSANSNADALSRIGSLAKERSEIHEIDPDTKAKIFQEEHDSILVGHRGMNKTYEAIKRYYQCPNM